MLSNDGLAYVSLQKPAKLCRKRALYGITQPLAPSFLRNRTVFTPAAAVRLEEQEKL